MAFQNSDPDEERIRRDRHVHGGLPEQALNDDQLAHEAEDERVDAGLDPFNPDDVPPATDTPPLETDIRDTEEWQEERAELRREEDKDEVWLEGSREKFPPTHYDE